MLRFRCLAIGLVAGTLVLTTPALAQPFGEEPDPMDEPMDEPAGDEVPFGTDPATEPEPQPAPEEAQPAPTVEPAGEAELDQLVPWIDGASFITRLEWGIDPKPDPAAGPFEFHGYLRSTFGANAGLNALEEFNMPLGPGSYHLGNDSVTYGEASLQSNWLPTDGGAWFTTKLTMALLTDVGEQFGDAAVALREAYVQAGNVLEGSPDMTFWAGQRYYRRHDVHTNDFFFLSSSAYGAGFQGANLGPGKLAFSFLGGSEGTVTDNGVVNEVNLDTRLYDIAAGADGRLQAGVTLALAPGGEVGPGADAGAIGVAIDATLLSLGVLGGYNKATLEFGTGPARDFLQYQIPAVDESNGAWRLRVTDTLLMQQSPGMSLLGTFIFQYSDDGDAPGSDPFYAVDGTLVSIGARPIFHLGTHTAIATEAALDYLKPSESDDSGVVGKLTVAPTIRGAGAGFWARPEIRAFITAAFWNDTLGGAVGGPAVADDTFGLSFGVQAESWW